jgi:hypothetical protein
LRRNAQAVAVSVEQDTLAFASSTLGGLNPLAPAGALVHTLDKSQGAAFNVGTVVTSHDGFDGLCSLIGVVERNRADVVVEHVSLNNSVEKLTTNKPEFAINCRSSATDVVPGFTSVVRKGWIGVLKVGDRN